MGNRNRPIGPSTVPGRAHFPSGGGGRHNSIFNIRCVQQDMLVLYENEVSKHPQQSPRGGVMEQTNGAV